ncbi:DVUA0089 family protein [Almyronema epifaneia]|uniref:DVUA0089 family protein n=1 Tax=Almyronema epifaneia S1 TaxID=2991925 RepID=A0ABW6IBY7_9CYAN
MKLSTVITGLSAIALSSFMSAAKAQTIPASRLQQELQLAVCLNAWDYALDLSDPLIASSEISPSDRAQLIQLRRQLQNYQARGTVVANQPNCEAVLAQTITAAEVSLPERPVEWARAYEALFASLYYRPGQGRNQSFRPILPLAGVSLRSQIDIPALSPETPIDTRNGSGVVAGEVSTYHQVYSFVAGLGDRVTIAVDVTEILPGTLYQDDDSQLFLFNSEGQLLAENDDLGRLQSQITDFLVPRTGLYYVVVTTYDNDPVLDREQRVIGWENNGGSAIEYTLTLAGVTPTAVLMRPTLSNEPDQ